MTCTVADQDVSVCPLIAELGRRWESLRGGKARGVNHGVDVRIVSPVLVIRKWLAGWPPRKVAIQSPLPASECLRRLAQATTPLRRTRSYFSLRFPKLAGPRFQGSVSQELIQVERDADVRRGFYPAELNARLDPADGGGTLLAGTVGLSQRGRKSRPLVLIPHCAITFGLSAPGLTLTPAPPPTLILRPPLILLALYTTL